MKMVKGLALLVYILENRVNITRDSLLLPPVAIGCIL